MWSLYHARLHRRLKEEQWLPQHARILIAVSGGQDSVCLAKFLLDLQPHWHWYLAIVHCNHRWRPDSTANAHFVEGLAQQWQLPYKLVTALEPPATEAAARTWRYQAFREVACTLDCSHVVTGHTQSDRAETVLLNLLRGASVTGIGTLQPVRPLGAVQLVRPLLDLSRTDTAAVCRQQQLPIWQDTTNLDCRYRRNRLRRDVIPYLREHFNAKVETALAQTAELLAADRAYFAAEVARVAPEVIRTAPPALDRDRLRQLPLALQRRLIHRFLQEHLPGTPTFTVVEAVRHLLNAGNGSQTSTLRGGYCLRVHGQWLQLTAMPPQPQSAPADSAL
ncbi:tRNA lysidine(34) synthetase TilS [Parathermosynechococcus lividus]